MNEINKSATIAARAFQDKISKFCEQRLASVLPGQAYDQFLRYMMDMIALRLSPPRYKSKLDWYAISEACGLETKIGVDVQRLASPALEAIARWIAGSEGMDPKTSRTGSKKPTGVGRQSGKTVGRMPTSVSANAAKLAANSLPPARAQPGIQPRPVTEFPVPIFSVRDDPSSFHEAFQMQVRRHGDSYLSLHRAVVRPGETFDTKTLLTWMTGFRVPRSVDSLDVLSRIERRYRLPDGYFKAKLPNIARSAVGHDVGDAIGPAERRRLAWHLPDNFNSLPLAKREEILEWVRRVIISGSTDFRRFQAAATKQRYAIRFPGVTYGGRSIPARPVEPNGATGDQTGVPIEDPDLLSGVVDAPPRLAMEMADLIRFKTATLTAVGFQRNGVWGEETASQKIEHLGLMFGSLAASPKGDVRGYGVPLSHLTFGLLVFPGIWDWYLQWRERRRGFYTAWEVDMLSISLSLTRDKTGWLRQHPELAARVQPIGGLVSQEEIEDARNDWNGACERFILHAGNRIKEIQRVARVHRDPFEPIMVVLEAESPLAEYRKITDEVLRCMPDEARYPRAAAETIRSFLMLRLGLHLGLRQKNLRQLLICPRGHCPTSERRLEDMRRGELRWSERDGGWEVLIPSNAFKNATSSFFGAKPFRLILPDLLELYKHIDAYVARHRSVLLGGAKDPGTFFVKTVKTTSIDAAYDQTTFYEAWRLTIQRYGIYNPYTGRGAIKGLLPHGPHNVRDVLATHILKQTGSYEQASYAIQDTPDMVSQHYGRFLPQDKAALAARILNQVWAAA